MTKEEFLECLRNGDFGQLFIECGWNNPSSRAVLPFWVGEESFAFFEAAQQKGFRILVCKSPAIPDATIRRQLDARIRKMFHDYLAVYVSSDEPFHHVWSVPVKSVDKRQLVTVEYVQDDQATFLHEKLRGISFSFDESPTIVDVADRVNKAFLVNATEVTKKFYQQFRKEHDRFVDGIRNIAGKEQREWYASVILNRLMFCYFIQKKGFLNFDENYLGNKLRETQARKGKDKFYESFYRNFLKQLFSDCLDKPVAARSDYFVRKYGRIPYLNGGMFSMHQIEKENKDIDIPDKVFEQLFAFFDQWHWHLDNRITASGRDINPDVLGYIFEQYINDRAQMGAYYTKEDITEYIGRNTIVPWLWKKAVGDRDIGEFLVGLSPRDSRAAGSRVPRDRIDRYIFPAMRKGVDLPLPPEIAKGVPVEPQKTLRARRANWNKPADEKYALPTEIWREAVARRQRCAEIREKFANGEIKDIHDFITYNLDIRTFVEDVIRQTSDHTLVLSFYKALREVTILDPTCGSGAFLFAALNILEPLYEACIDRMEDFHSRNSDLFADELAEMGGARSRATANLQYFIYKSIILRNLYGVDIMHEATEIARLRLFLKMVAVVDVDPSDPNLGLDPLPDIDFNIRCGNTLVGFVNPKDVKDALLPDDELALDQPAYEAVEKTASGITALYDRFKELQQKHDETGLFRSVKKQLLESLSKLDDELDRAMAKRLYGINPDTPRGSKEFKEWKRNTQPFHWYSNFYGITVARGGFDVIIGNPPYVSMRNIDYLRNSEVFSCSDLYGHVVRRSLNLLSPSGKHGFIVMHNLAFSKDFADVRKLLTAGGRSLWCSFYARIPSGLFSVDSGEGARVRNCIYLTSNDGGQLHTTRLHRWFTEYRPVLFENLRYTRFEKGNEFPMFNSEALRELLTDNQRRCFASLVADKSLYYQATGYNYLCVTENPAPCYDGKKAISGASKEIVVPNMNWKAYLLLFCGKITLSRWLTYGDDFHITLKPFNDSRVNFEQMSKADMAAIEKLYSEFEKRLPKTLQFKLNCGKRIGTYNISRLWDITDRSDAIFLKYLCDNPSEAQEAIEDHISSCVISGRKDSIDE